MLGYFVNGAKLYSWGDTTSYNGQGAWYNLALKFEIYDVDMCFGHAGDMNVYHRECLTLFAVFNNGCR